MEVIQYTPEMVKPLTEFYNNLIAEVPHCYPVKEEEFVNVMRGVTSQSENSDNVLEHETAFVAIQNGAIVSVIHIGLYKDEDNDDIKHGVIRFLGYKRGERQAGQTVLEKAEEYLKEYNVSTIRAFSTHQYSFYHVEYANLSLKLDHIHALLLFNGYESENSWCCLDWENYDVSPESSPIPIEISVNLKDGRGNLPDCKIKIHINGEEVGECESVSGAEFSSHPNAQDWIYTEWIGIEEDYRGQGLGKFLLMYSLQEFHKIGYKHASLSAFWNNYHALLFYYKLGYRVVDRTCLYEKVLTKKPTKNED